MVDIESPTTDHEDFVESKAMWQQQYPEEPFDLDKEDTTRMFDIQCLWCGGTNVMDRYVSKGEDKVWEEINIPWWQNGELILFFLARPISSSG